MIGNRIDKVDIPEVHNVSGTAAAAILKKAPHGRAAKDFINFLISEEAAAIYKKYGFEPLRHD
ncbi:MAG: substrate-binding domain-containing protein [Desulfobacterales bacterium]